MQKSWDNEQNKNSKPSFFAHHLLTLSGIKKNIKISFILKGHMRAQCAGHRWYTLLVTISSRGSDRCRHSTLITLPINLCQDFDQSTKNKNDYGRISSGNKSPSVAKLSSAVPFLFSFPYWAHPPKCPLLGNSIPARCPREPYPLCLWIITS